MKVLSFPFLSGANPYLHLINTNLSELGVEFILPSKSFADIEANISPETIFHLHWPSKFYSSENYGEMQNKVDRFGKLMEEIRRQKGHLVWTAHNILPHEVIYLELEIEARKILLKYCSAVITHCRYGAKILKQTYGAQNLNICVIPHPDLSSNYQNVYSREIARENLKLDQNSFVFVSIGQIRNYKGITDLVCAFAKINNPNIILVIAGDVSKDFDLRKILKIQSIDSRIKTYFGSISDEFLIQLYQASNASIHNYASVLTSGSAILAMGFSRAVIAPELGCLKELLADNRGLLFKPNNETSLIEILNHAANIDVDSIGENGRDFISKIPPNIVAKMIFNLYQSLM